MKKHEPENSCRRVHLYETAQETTVFHQEERRHDKKISLVAVLAIVLFFLFWASLLFVVPYEQFRFSPAWIVFHVKDRFYQLYTCLFGQGSTFQITIFQYLAVILAGSALAACGTIFQGSFRNVLAGPSTMGVMSGGTLGCLGAGACPAPSRRPPWAG